MAAPEKGVLMKVVSSALCGILLALPLGSAVAQTGSSTAGAASTPHQSGATPASPHAASPSERSIGTLDPNAPPPPAHPITAAQTKQLLDLMQFKKTEDRNWSQMITMNKQAAPFIPNDVWTDVQSGIDGIDYSALVQPIYARYLSEDDATKALAFYSTPAGQRVLQAMPSILGESAAASQQKGRQVGRDAIEKHRTEIEAAQKKYQEEHAPAGGPGSAPGAGPGSGAGAGAGAGPGSGASSGSGTSSGSGKTTTKPQGTATKPQ